MALDKDTVAHIASLARIEVAEAELEAMAAELGQIITWVEQLAEVDTDGVKPMSSVVGTSLKKRADVVTDGGYAERIVANAPDPVGHYFTVPKVIINACTPRWREDGFPPVVEVSPDLRAETIKKWGHLLD